MNKNGNNANTYILTRDEFAEKFSRKLDRLMRSKCITNRELANRVDCSSTTINAYRHGQYLPDAYMLYRLSKAIPCTIDALTDF